MSSDGWLGARNDALSQLAVAFPIKNEAVRSFALVLALGTLALLSVYVVRTSNRSFEARGWLFC